MLAGISINQIRDAFNLSFDTVNTNTNSRYKDDIFKLELEKNRAYLVENVNVQKHKMLRIMHNCTTLAEDQNIPAKHAQDIRVLFIIQQSNILT